MDNKWREIWNRRKPVTGGLTGDWEHIYLELKRLNGYDVMGDGVPLNDFLNFHAGLVALLDLTPVVGTSARRGPTSPRPSVHLVLPLSQQGPLGEATPQRPAYVFPPVGPA